MAGCALGFPAWAEQPSSLLFPRPHALPAAEQGALGLLRFDPWLGLEGAGALRLFGLPEPLFQIEVDGARAMRPYVPVLGSAARPGLILGQSALQRAAVAQVGERAFGGSPAVLRLTTRSGANERSTAAYATRSALGRGASTLAGASYSGPVVRDRAFFFLSADRRWSREARPGHARAPAVREVERALQELWPKMFADEFGDVEHSDNAGALFGKVELHPTERSHAWLVWTRNDFEAESGLLPAGFAGRSTAADVQGGGWSLSMGFQRAGGAGGDHDIRIRAARDRLRIAANDGLRLPGPNGEERPFPEVWFWNSEKETVRIGGGLRGLAEGSRLDHLEFQDVLSWRAGPYRLRAGLRLWSVSARHPSEDLSPGLYLFDSPKGFKGYVQAGPGFVHCSDGSASVSGDCPSGARVTGPLLEFRQRVNPAQGGEPSSGSFTRQGAKLDLRGSWQVDPEIEVAANLALGGRREFSGTGTSVQGGGLSLEAGGRAEWLPAETSDWVRARLAWDAYRAELPPMLLAWADARSGAGVARRSSGAGPDALPPPFGERVNALGPAELPGSGAQRFARSPRGVSLSALVERRLRGASHLRLKVGHSRATGPPRSIGRGPGATDSEFRSDGALTSTQLLLEAGGAALAGRLDIRASWSLEHGRVTGEAEFLGAGMTPWSVIRPQPDTGMVDEGWASRGLLLLAWTLPGEAVVGAVGRVFSGPAMGAAGPVLRLDARISRSVARFQGSRIAAWAEVFNLTGSAVQPDPWGGFAVFAHSAARHQGWASARWIQAGLSLEGR